MSMFPCPAPSQCTGAQEHHSAENCLYLQRQKNGGSAATAAGQGLSTPVSAASRRPLNNPDMGLGAKLNGQWDQGFNAVVAPGFTRDVGNHNENREESIETIWVAASANDDGSHQVQGIAWDAPSEIDFAEEPEFKNNQHFKGLNVPNEFAYPGPVYDVPAEKLATVTDNIAAASAEWNHRNTLGLSSKDSETGNDWEHDSSKEMKLRISSRDESQPSADYVRARRTNDGTYEVSLTGSARLNLNNAPYDGRGNIQRSTTSWDSPLMFVDVPAKDVKKRAQELAKAGADFNTGERQN